MSLHVAILSFAAVAALLTIVPGLDTAIVLRSAISEGPAHAVLTALGVCSGAFAWGIAAAVGASAVLAASHTAYLVLKLVGAGYMVWLGVSMWRAGSHRPTAAAAPRAPSFRAAWLRGFGTNVLNPKVGIFYLAMIPQFMAAGVPHLLMGVILAAVHNAMALLWFGALIAGADVAKRWLSGPRFARVTDRVTGTVLIGFGIGLVTRPH